MKTTLKNILQTFITEALVLSGFLIVYRLILQNFGTEGVGEYSLIRKVANFTQPVLILGLVIGLPRYLAMSKDEEQRGLYIKSGFFVVISLTVLFLAIVNVFRVYFAKIFFGDIAYTNLVLPFSVLLMGLVIHGLVYSYFHGLLLVKTFNFLKLVNLLLVPIFVIIFLKNIPISQVITLIGVSMIMVAILFSLPFIKTLFISSDYLQLKNSLKNLFHYSLPRVPGDFGLAGLFALGPVFAAHLTNMKEVGYLSVSQSLLRGVCGILAPLGIILLPKVSQLTAQGKQSTVKENLDLLIPAISQCSIFICIQLFIFTDILIKHWLGPQFLDAIAVMRITLLAMFFYTFYITMRSILDAVNFKALNTINIYISLGVFLITAGILLFLFKLFSPIISLSIASSTALACLGTLSYISIRNIYPYAIKKDGYYVLIALIINAIFVLISLAFKLLIIQSIYHLFIFGISLGFLYLAILWALKTEWIRKLVFIFTA